MKYAFTLYILMSFLTAHAQDFRSALYQSYLMEKMDTWKEIIGQMEEEYLRTSDTDLLFDILETEYGYMGWLVSGKKKKEAEEVLGNVERHMSILTQLGKDDARFYSLKGAFFGYQILLDPLKAPSLGRKSMEANEKAMQLDPEEPQAWLEKANMDYYRPAIFGGSKKKAVPNYEKAVALFEASPERIKENWVYLNCLAGLAVAYENTKKYSEAGEVYRKLLEIEPSFKLVKEDLYPKFQKKHPGK